MQHGSDDPAQILLTAERAEADVSATAPDGCEPLPPAAATVIAEELMNETATIRDGGSAKEDESGGAGSGKASTSVDASEWPERAWPATASPRGRGFEVLIDRSVLSAIQHHGESSGDVEICGVVVGNVYRDAVGPYLFIDASVRGDFAGSSAANVTFTAATWNHIQGIMERDHPDQRIVGWYHTHPGFGIFLSDMDLFIHGNFFNLPWQVAFVYDPKSGEDGMFVWKDGKAERSEFAINEAVEEEPQKELRMVAVSPEISAAALADFSRRMQRMEGRQKGLLVALPFLVLTAIAWPLVLFTIMNDRGGTSRVPVSSGLREIAREATASTEPATPLPPGRVSATLPAVEAFAASQPVVVTPGTATPGATTTMTGTNRTGTNGTGTGTGGKVDDKVGDVIRPGPTTKVGPRVLEQP